ncbi:hypothetical protein BG015_007889 [Linnemannia schmuckeri]|uniref:Uncharacterized protein n=1 Tax=Linnemannia schmuckeri TaxID=64567 RepID=A0A9P5S193_9FUNG|nr:hypothetical protein BG015_007889 [Linnemannia schmuckeri]
MDYSGYLELSGPYNNGIAFSDRVLEDVYMIREEAEALAKERESEEVEEEEKEEENTDEEERLVSSYRRAK